MLMAGTVLNALGILLGGLVGLFTTRQLPARVQQRIQTLLAAFTAYVGMATVWEFVSGSWVQVLKQLGIVLLALVLGHFLGRALRLQALHNRLGQYSQQRLLAARPGQPGHFGTGFVTCAILFCSEPLAIQGALQDGLAAQWKPLALKAVLDGLATLSFVKTFGSGPVLSAVPVVAYQGTLTLVFVILQPWMVRHGLRDVTLATSGMLVLYLSLILFDVKRVPMADYLPALVLAPLFAWLWS